MRIATLFLCLTSYLVLETLGKEIYLITTPNILLSDAVHNINVFVSVDATMVIETIHVQSNITNKTDVIKLKRGIQSIRYFVPFIGRHIGNSLKLRFIGETVKKEKFINETREINIILDNFIIFSETDKPIYKPGDLVKVRAMAIYATNLMLSPPPSGQFVEILKVNQTFSSVNTFRNRTNNFESITLETPDNVKMAQWLNVSFEDAMNMTFRLSTDPVFGKWKITLILGSKKEFVEFTVKKYVLPRFVVELVPPAVVLMSDTSTTVQICATYSTGKNLQADIRGQMCVHIYKEICRDFKASLNGTEKCTSITMQDSLFGQKPRNEIYFSRPVSVNVTVTERGTTNSINKVVELPNMKRQSYEIKLLSRRYFKPGLPYFGRLSLMKHDGQPQSNTTVEISVRSSFFESWGFQENITSDEVGIVDFVMPYIPVQSGLSIEVNGEKVNKSSNLDAPTLYDSLSQWESVDNQYLQITPINTTIFCPGTLKLSLLLNGDVSSYIIYVQMLSRGIIYKMLEFETVPFKCINRDDHLGHYECTDDGRVKCLPGWTGDSCLEPICNDVCQNGACTAPGRCSCKQGWTGANCDKCFTSVNCVHGYCKYGYDCQCLPGWSGYMCDRKGPIVHNYNNVTQEPITTAAPKSRSTNQKLIIFEREIQLPLDWNIGPDLHIVVYYIDASNEIVADSIEINTGLTNCSHSGGGRFEFDKSSTSPGEKLTLTIDPGTVNRSCGVKISDVALSEFGESSNINLDHLVLKLIELTHKITQEDRRWFGQEVCLTGNTTTRTKRRARFYPGLGQGYDSRKSFTQGGFTAITNARIVNAKCRYMIERETAFLDGMYQNRIVLASAPEANVESDVANVKKQIRDFFPETWIFDYYKVTPTRINLTVPDSMTSWKVNTFCMTERGLWIPPTRSLTVLLPFFADIYVPYSIKMGERLQLPVKLFNYVDACYEIKADIIVNSNEIKITGTTSFTVCLCFNEVKTINFNIKALVIGTLNITVKAKSKYSSFCSNDQKQDKVVNLSDAIRRQLLVEPPGIPSETTYSDIICCNNEQLGLKSDFKIPSDIVRGSLRTYVVYNGDVMGQTFDNLDRLVKMPYGCGEQNMVAFVPSIGVLNYLTNMKIKNEELENKAKGYIIDGYRRQLTYKHPDGSYSAFGKSDKNGNTWLTAFVVKSFTDASKFVTIDKSVLKESIQYLEKMQKPNGCFNELGKLLSSSMAGGLKNNGKTDQSLLTAYVLISLANVKLTKTSFSIKKALACVKSGLNSTSSSYRLALSAYALSIHDKSNNINEVLSQLEKMSTSQGRYRFWKSERDPIIVYDQINSADIETTGYAFLALKNVQTLPYLSSIIYWLASKQNSLGGYFSTQDTIVALSAIAMFAEKIGKTAFDKVSLSIDLDSKPVGSELLTDANRLITRLKSVGSLNVSYVSVTANGTGCVSVQLKSLYNIEKIYQPTEVFKITVRSLFTNVTACTNIEIFLCSSYLRKDRNSNMVLITVDFPSGWELAQDEKNQLQSLIMTPLKRIDFQKNKMHLYYDSFSYADEDNGLRCFTFRLDQVSKVKDLKPSFVRIVDYYKPEIYIDTSYIVPMSTCEIPDTTKPKPPKEIRCPKCFDDLRNGVSDFISRICPWTYSGIVMSGKKTLKKRKFYQSSQQVFFEWTVNLEPANCSCLKSWPNINEQFAIVSTDYLWMEETLNFSNTSTLYTSAMFYEAFKSDLSTSCQSASNLAMMLTRVLPDFKKLTTINETCPACILNSNLYYKVKNVTEFICSKQERWSLEIYSIYNATINGTLSNIRNDTISILATFPLTECFCLQQIRDSEKSFDIIDVNNVLSKASNETITIALDNNFQIVERSVYSVYKYDPCKT